MKEKQMAEAKKDIIDDIEESLDDMADGDILDDLQDDLDEIETLRAERDEFRDRFMRALADAENTRKRGERDRREAEQYGGSKLARDLLPVYDNMKRALDAVGEEQREGSKALIEGIGVVADGDSLLAPSVTTRLVAEFAKRRVNPTVDEGVLKFLTAREREVLSLVGRGLSNHEIADQLFVSPATVKTHVGRALMKLNARDRAQLVVIAYESGLVTPGG